jgi:hypothetical protein
MESKTPKMTAAATTLYSGTAMYWLMVVVAALAVIFDFLERIDPLRTASGVSLVVAFVLIALSGGAPTHPRKAFVYAFLLISIALTVARWFAR